MKSLITMSVLLVAGAASATGGFWCQSPDGKFEISATTGRVVGNPIVNYKVVADGNVIREERMGNAGVAQYSANQSGTNLMIIDKDALHSLVTLKTSRLDHETYNDQGETDSYSSKEAGVAKVLFVQEEGVAPKVKFYTVECDGE